MYLYQLVLRTGTQSSGTGTGTGTEVKVQVQNRSGPVPKQILEPLNCEEKLGVF